MTPLTVDQLTEEHQQYYKSILPESEGEEIREQNLTRGVVPIYQLGGGTKHDPQVALGDHLSAQADPPATCHRGLWTGYTDVLANDELGDCGPASCIHGNEGMHHAAGTPIPPWARNDAVVFYGEEGGYVVGQPNTDRGSDNAVMFRKWQNPGILCAADGTRHPIAGTVFVDITNEVEMRVAIVEFAVVFRAFAMPLSAQGQKQWEVVGDGKTGNSKPYSWGGHDVVGHAYGTDYVDDDSWGLWIPSSTQFDQAYGIQAIVVVTPEMLNRQGVSPTGLNWTSLNQAMSQFIAVPAS